MRLPNREFAYVPKAKIYDYLLSEIHLVGRAKAKYFRALGFNETNADLLEQGLLKIAQTCEVNKALSTPHGEKYIIDGILTSPFKRSSKIRTVWIIDKGLDRPRFITAFPN